MKFIKKNKYSCVLCSNTNEKAKYKIFFCLECKKIRNYIRDQGIKNILQKIEYNKASAPPY